MPAKKFLLAVQGEGRGHMTQAISMYEMLLERGHEVCAVILGTSSSREIPSFFHTKINAPVIKLQSPNFVTDEKNKSINLPKTVFSNLAQLKTFHGSLRTIDELIKEQMVPVQGHYEQFCNSRDAYKAGAGIFSDHFDLSKLDRFSVTFDGNRELYKNWVLNAKQRIYNEILSA